MNSPAECSHGVTWAQHCKQCDGIWVEEIVLDCLIEVADRVLEQADLLKDKDKMRVVSDKLAELVDVLEKKIEPENNSDESNLAS